MIHWASDAEEGQHCLCCCHNGVQQNQMMRQGLGGGVLRLVLVGYRTWRVGVGQRGKEP